MLFPQLPLLLPLLIAGPARYFWFFLFLYWEKPRLAVPGMHEYISLVLLLFLMAVTQTRYYTCEYIVYSPYLRSMSLIRSREQVMRSCLIATNHQLVQYV